MTTKLDVLNAELKNYGLSIDSYSPGDGVTRYRFFDFPEDSERATDYFAGYGIFTALGWKEAITFATGYCRGMERAYASVGMSAQLEDTR